MDSEMEDVKPQLLLAPLLFAFPVVEFLCRVPLPRVCQEQRVPVASN